MGVDYFGRFAKMVTSIKQTRKQKMSNYYNEIAQENCYEEAYDWACENFDENAFDVDQFEKIVMDRFQEIWENKGFEEPY